MSSYRYSQSTLQIYCSRLLPMAAASKTENVEVGRRILLLCMAKGWEQTKFSALIGPGVSPQQLNNYIKGRHKLPTLIAARICTTTGSDFDYLYRGLMDRLPEDLIDGIAEAERDLAKTPQPRKRKRAKRS